MPTPRTAPDAAALARVVDQLGGEDFGARLLDWLAPSMQASHATAFRFDADLGARVVLTASAGGESIALQSARVYAGSGLYRLDGMQAYLRGRSKAPADGRPQGEGVNRPPVLRLRREQITDTAYGEQLWDRFGLVDRLSTLALQDGAWTALNLYRDRAGGAFGPRERRRFTALAPLLLALLHRHLRALEPAAQVEPAVRLGQEAASALLGRLPVRLSAREHEVCALTLAGHTREGIGLRLGIAPSSVATLRKRAYLKLGIHGAGELFALCLQHARDLAVRPPAPG